VKLSTEILEDEGSALVDFIGFGLLLQIPVLMFTTLALSLQHQQFALEAIARHGIRAHVLFPDNLGTTIVIHRIASDFGLEPSDLSWNLTCTPDPKCVASGSIVRLEIKLGGLSAESMQGI
jgi:hypothetical protein